MKKRRSSEKDKKLTVLTWAFGFLLLISVIFMLSTGVLRILIGPPDQTNLSPSQSPGIVQPSLPVQPQTEAAQNRVVSPDLIGMSLEKVLIDPLFRQMFEFEPRFKYSETIPVGVVLSQQPAPGEQIGEDKIIVLTVSKGSQIATMPDLMGLPRAEAEKILTDAGIMFEITIQGGPSDTPINMQIVVNTVPTAGRILYKTDEKALLTVSPKNISDAGSEQPPS